jgi:hypothetical protein
MRSIRWVGAIAFTGMLLGSIAWRLAVLDSEHRSVSVTHNHAPTPQMPDKIAPSHGAKGGASRLEDGRVETGSSRPREADSADIPTLGDSRREADRVTGLVGEDLENFNRAFMRGLQSYGPVFGAVDVMDAHNEIRARYAQVAEQLLGPERGHAYMEALFGAADRRSQRFAEEVQAGKPLEEAARAAGIDGDDAEVARKR